MGNSFESIDRLATGIARTVLRFRWLVILATIAGALAIEAI